MVALPTDQVLLALTCFEPAIRLVDHIGTTTTTDDAAIAVTVFKRLQRVADFHFLARLNLNMFENGL